MLNQSKSPEENIEIVVIRIGEEKRILDGLEIPLSHLGENYTINVDHNARIDERVLPIEGSAFGIVANDQNREVQVWPLADLLPNGSNRLVINNDERLPISNMTFQGETGIPRSDEIIIRNAKGELYHSYLGVLEQVAAKAA